MRQKNIPLLLVVTAAFATSTAHAATTGNLKFEGQVNAGTCNLAAGDVSRTVTLPHVQIAHFDSSVYAGAHDFEISAECESDVRNVTFLFTGTANTDNGQLFNNTGTSEGVALWLYSRGATDVTIPANGSIAQRSRTIATVSSKALLPLTAAYHRTGKPITKGTLKSTVAVSISYD